MLYRKYKENIIYHGKLFRQLFLQTQQDQCEY